MDDKDKNQKKPKDAAPQASQKKASKPKEKVEASAEAIKKVETKPKSKSSQPAVKRRPLVVGTQYAKWGEAGNNWKLIDASGVSLGRLSSQVANLLMGKNNPNYTRHADTGDFVIVINAAKVALTGKKWEQKTYHYHTNFPGGIKSFTAKELLEKTPERLIERAVYGMLPKGHMGRRWYKKLRVFAADQHPHVAQKPQVIEIQKFL